MNLNKFFNLGVKIAATIRNKTESDLSAVSGYLSAIDDTTNPNYGNIQKIACKVAVEAFDEAGKKNEFTYHLFDSLTKTATWLPELNIFSDAVLKALGTIHYNDEMAKQAAQNDEITKMARLPLTGILNSLSESAPDAVKTMATVGGIGGSLTGGLYWLMNRHSNEDEDEAEVIKAKIDYYNKLSDEIKNQLKNNPNASSSDIRNAIQKTVV